jgi:hypothetical protein
MFAISLTLDRGCDVSGELFNQISREALASTHHPEDSEQRRTNKTFFVF